MKSRTNNAVTAAIGDGANDVNMIQQAHLGFGLMGKEGNQAATYADYSIAKFKDLRRLLFWHGRGFAWKLAFAIKICVFKNVVWCMPQYFLNMWAGMSSVLAQEDIFRVCYLIFLTIDTYVFYIIFEKDVSFADHAPSDAQKFSKEPIVPKEPTESEEDCPELPFKLSKYYEFCRE